MHHPRQRLAVLLDELDWSPERLARHLNAVYGAQTVGLTTPYAWLQGRKPRGRLPWQVAELLSARLKRTVTAVELWPQLAHDTGAAMSLWWSDGLRQAAGVVARQSGLPPADANDRAAIGHLATSWLLEPAPAAPASRGTVAVADGHVRDLSTAADVVRGIARDKGGGHALPLAQRQLASAGRLVTTGAYGGESGRALFRAVAVTACRAGYAALDTAVDHSPLARLYWSFGLHAAKAAGDTGTGAAILTGLALDAGLDGDLPLALHLARTADNALLTLEPGEAHLMAVGLQARALAASGQERRARAKLEALHELHTTTVSVHAAAPERIASYITPVHRSVARSLLELGRARELIDYAASTGTCTGAHAPVPEAELTMVLARCHQMLGDHEAAIAHAQWGLRDAQYTKSLVLARQRAAMEKQFRTCADPRLAEAWESPAEVRVPCPGLISA